MAGLMQIICAWCKRVLGEKPGEGVTHTICPICKEKELENI